MYSLLHAAVHLLLLQQVARAQWVDRPALDPTSTTSADFTIATVPNEPPNAMEGVIYDVYPTTTAAETLAAAIATGAAKATAVAASAATAIASGSPKDDDKGECRLLGPFALFVQLALGALALTSLVYKRWRERPQRPLKIWFFDASKQVFGSVLVHVANVFMSMLTSGRFSIKVEPAAVATTAAVMMKRMAASEGDGGDAGEYVPNPCSFYLLNLAIDTTIGIPILIFLLRVFTKMATHTPFGQPAESIQSGHYGSPPSAWWWLKQSLIYFCGLFGMKFCVLIIFIMFPWISRVGDWALSWTEGNEKVQIVFVMMLFPLIMNALQYYIIDSFIKAKASKEDTEGHSRPGSEGGGLGDGGVSYQRISGADTEAHEDGVPNRRSSLDVERDAKGKIGPQASKSASPVHAEYDPEVDGDRAPAATGGSSMMGPGGNVPKELLPKE